MELGAEEEEAVGKEIGTGTGVHANSKIFVCTVLNCCHVCFSLKFFNFLIFNSISYIFGCDKMEYKNKFYHRTKRKQVH
jgi:hypothetical protein